MSTYQGKPVTVVRPARKGDPDYDEEVQQLVVKLEDGTEKTVARKDVQDQGGQQQGKPQSPA
jgi:hypothetical protein